MFGSNPTPFWGDIFYADLGIPQPGQYVIGKIRPVVIVSNNMGNLYGNTITVVPLTSGQKRLNLPTHIEITPDDIQSSGDYLKPSTILTEQIITIDKTCLKAYIGRINSVAIIGKIYEALKIQLAI